MQYLKITWVAIGSQSAVASLWKTDDAATVQLIAKFYQNWRGGLSKAKALQATQIAWLQAHQQELSKHRRILSTIHSHW